MSKNRKLMFLAILTLIDMIITAFSLYKGLYSIFPHAFYIPIIVASYWFPNRGIPYSAIISLIYISEFTAIETLLGRALGWEFLSAAVRAFMFFIIGSIATVLRWESYAINMIIEDINKFVFVHDSKKGDYYYSPSIHGIFDQGFVKLIEKKGISSIISKGQKNRFDAMAEKAMEGVMANDIFCFKNSEGKRTVMSFTLIPTVERGRVVGYKGIAEDITKFKEYEDCIRGALDDKAVLLSEVHHRVRNNLTMINGFINLQLKNVEDENARSCLKDIENKIITISSVHESLYDNERLNDIDLHTHIDKLIGEISNSTDPSFNLNVKTDMVGLSTMDFDSLMSFSLVINELFSNSMKHAFRNKTEGNIWLRISEDDEEITAIYRDDGPGMPEGYDMASAGATGLNLMKRIVESKLNGTLEQETGPGATWIIRFPHKIKKRSDEVGAFLDIMKDETKNADDDPSEDA